MKDVFKHIATILIMLVTTIGTAFGYVITESVSFCCTQGKIEADSLDLKTAEWRGQVVSDFMEFINGQKLNGRHEDYCETYCNILTEDSFRISIDKVRFRDKVYSGKILRHIPENDFTEIDIPSEAPEKCLATRRDSTLIIVWCNLFDDDKKVCETVKTILTAEK